MKRTDTLLKLLAFEELPYSEIVLTMGGRVDDVDAALAEAVRAGRVWPPVHGSPNPVYRLRPGAANPFLESACA